VIRVLIADDHGLMRNGLRAILDAQQDIEVVGEAEHGAQAVENAIRLRPDVVIMDIRMPRLDGIEATKRLAVQGEKAPKVLVLTTFDLDDYVYEALRAGAAGFLLKDTPPRQLAEAVRTIAAGESLLAPAVTKRLIERYVSRPPGDTARRERLPASRPHQDALRTRCCRTARPPNPPQKPTIRARLRNVQPSLPVTTGRHSGAHGPIVTGPPGRESSRT
jgi:DNA-binding NarL/FixJ family response regulator